MKKYPSCSYGIFTPPRVVRKKPIDGRYSVGDDGVIYSDGCALEPIGGVSVNIHGERRKIAYLVARAWVRNPEGRPYVVHKNGDVTDNRPDNLSWSEVEEVRKRGPKPATRYCSAYTRDGEHLGIFRNPSAGAQKLGVDVRIVRRCLGGYQKTAGGYFWRWGV